MNELLHFYSSRYLPTPHPACIEHASGHVYGGREAFVQCYNTTLLAVPIAIPLVLLVPHLLVPSITPFHWLHFVGYVWAVKEKSQHCVNGLCQSAV